MHQDGKINWEGLEILSNEPFPNYEVERNQRKVLRARLQNTSNIPDPDEEGFYPPSGTVAVASKKKRKPFEIFNLGAPERELIATVKEKHMMDVFKTIQDEVNKKIDVLENKVDGLEYEIRNLKKKNKC